MSFRYWEHGTRHWEYATAPTYRCPHTDRENPPSGLDTAAQALGVDPGKLGACLRRAHSGYGRRARRQDGTLTEHCETCGARMDKLGYSVRITDLSTDQASSRARINRRLGYGDLRETLAFKYLPTRTAAKDWCYSRYQDAVKNGLPSHD